MKKKSILYLVAGILISVLLVIGCAKKKEDNTALLLFLLLSQPVAPSALTYPASNIPGGSGTALFSVYSLVPSYTGSTATSFSVSPALSTGLSLSTSTGAISGTPTATSAKTTYTVTLTNAAGTTTKALKIIVGLTATAVTCNDSGIATGCNSTLAFSCTNDTTTCYSNVVNCNNSSFCVASLTAQTCQTGITGCSSGTYSCNASSSCFATQALCRASSSCGQ